MLKSRFASDVCCLFRKVSFCIKLCHYGATKIKPKSIKKHTSWFIKESKIKLWLFKPPLLGYLVLEIRF